MNFLRSSRGTRQHCSIWQMLRYCPLQQSDVVSKVAVPQFHKRCVLKRCLHCQCSTLSTTTPLSQLFLLIILHVLHRNLTCGDFPFLGRAMPVVVLPPPILLSIYFSFSFLKDFEALEDETFLLVVMYALFTKGFSEVPETSVAPETL